MSGIYAVLYAENRETAWSAQLERLQELSKQRGSDGKSTLVMHEAGGFVKPQNGRLYHRSSDGGREIDYRGIIGCAYSRPIALDQADAGPFVSESGNSAMTYDGVITGHTGESLLKYLSDGRFVKHWHALTAKLSGQFALIAITEITPDRIYYAVRAKPLYLLFDSLSRGIILSSSKDALQGLYHPTRSPQPVALEPYSSGVISIDGVITDYRSNAAGGSGSVVLSGGGLDSLVSAYDTRIRYPDDSLLLLYFDYHAKAAIEEVAANNSIITGLKKLSGTHKVSHLAHDAQLLNSVAKSNLTGFGKVSHRPVAGQASEWMPVRNTILLALAMAHAESNGCARVITGINQDAATAYPDNDEEWLNRMQQVVPYAVNGPVISLEAPLKRMSKVEIVKHGAQLKIPWSEVSSWSCYEGGKLHCGTCSSCRARRKAFKLGEFTDPTEYAE